MSKPIESKGWTACKGLVLDEAGCPAFMPDVGDEMLAKAITEAHNFRVSRLGEELAKAKAERDAALDLAKRNGEQAQEAIDAMKAGLGVRARLVAIGEKCQRQREALFNEVQLWRARHEPTPDVPYRGGLEEARAATDAALSAGGSE